MSYSSEGALKSCGKPELQKAHVLHLVVSLHAKQTFDGSRNNGKSLTM
jgi:hypothetical protein